RSMARSRAKGQARSRRAGAYQKIKAPARAGALCRDLACGSVLGAGAVPGDARNVRAGDADIGQFAVAELVELVQAGVVALPGLDEVDDCEQHVSAFLPVPLPGLCLPRNRVPCCVATGPNVALQLCIECILQIIVSS